MNINQTNMKKSIKKSARKVRTSSKKSPSNVQIVPKKEHGIFLSVSRLKRQLTELPEGVQLYDKKQKPVGALYPTPPDTDQRKVWIKIITSNGFQVIHADPRTLFANMILEQSKK